MALYHSQMLHHAIKDFLILFKMLELHFNSSVANNVYKKSQQTTTKKHTNCSLLILSTIPNWKDADKSAIEEACW